MEHNNKPAPEDKQPQAPARKGLSAENWIMLIGVISFVVFLWMFALFFLFSRQRGPVAWPSVIVEIAATRGFVLPPTWTPGPTPEFNPTAVGTPVYDSSPPSMTAHISKFIWSQSLSDRGAFPSPVSQMEVLLW